LRSAAAAGIAGPVGFLVMSFVLAALRPELIETQGWGSWPSSMALGGWRGIPQILTFLWLGACYCVFALGALRPALRSRTAWAGFLAVAIGDVLLAFPTDPPGADQSWHGTLHLMGVLLATVATLVAVVGVTSATRERASWRPWRFVAPVPFAAALIGLTGGFDLGWAKVVYVIGVTLPAAVAGWLLRRDATVDAATATKSG